MDHPPINPRRPRNLLRTRFFSAGPHPVRMSGYYQRDNPHRVEYEEFANYGDVPEDFRADRGVMEGFYGITLVLRGSATIHHPRIPGSLRVATGDLVHFTRILHTEHRWVDGDPGYLECGVCIDLGTGDRLVAAGLWPTAECVSITRVGSAPELAAALVDYIEAIPVGSIGVAGLHRRLARILEACEVTASRVGPSAEQVEAGFLAKAIDVLETNLAPHYTSADAARELGMPARTFRTRFMRAARCTPAAWQQRRRLERAEGLLRSHTVIEVSRTLGYSDPAVFSRQFKRAMGYPPSALVPKAIRDLAWRRALASGSAGGSGVVSPEVLNGHAVAV